MSFVYFLTPIILGYYIMEYAKGKARDNVALQTSVSAASAQLNATGMGTGAEVLARNDKLQNVLSNVQRSRDENSGKAMER